MVYNCILVLKIRALYPIRDLLHLSNRLPDGVGVERGFDGELEGYALVSNRVTAQPRLTPISEVTTSSSTVGQASVLSKKDQKRIDMQRELGKTIAESMDASWFGGLFLGKFFLGEFPKAPIMSIKNGQGYNTSKKYRNIAVPIVSCLPSSVQRHPPKQNE